MYGFIARQPIFNPDMNTVAYELLFRDGMGWQTVFRMYRQNLQHPE